MLVVPRESSGVPMEATRALVRRGIKRLHLVALPTSTLQADLLIGAGCVETLETSAVSLGEFGPAPRFTAAILGKTIRDEGRDLPGALRLDAGGREGRAVHSAARADRLGHPGAPAGLARDRQSVRQQRSDRAAARDQAGRRAVPCRHGGPLRQCVHRPRPRAADHGACGGAHHRDRGKDLRRQSDGRSGALGRHACRASMSIPSRSRRAAPGRCRCSITMRRTARISPTTPSSPRRAEGFARYLDSHVYAKQAA